MIQICPREPAEARPSVLREAGGVAVLFRPGAQITQHATGFNGRQLIGIAQQHEARLRAQGRSQRRHHAQIHHGCFVEHDEVGVERCHRVVAEAAITGAIAQQAVQRARLFRQPCDVRFGREPISNEPAARNPHRLRQSRCRLASRRGQANDWGRGGVLEQEQQHARDRRRLSRTRPARDDGELAVEGARDGNALPVRPIVARKERGDAGRERL